MDTRTYLIASLTIKEMHTNQSIQLHNLKKGSQLPLPNDNFKMLILILNMMNNNKKLKYNKFFLKEILSAGKNLSLLISLLPSYINE